MLRLRSGYSPVILRLFSTFLWLPKPTPTTTQTVPRWIFVLFLHFYADVVVENKLISSIFLFADADTNDDVDF